MTVMNILNALVYNFDQLSPKLSKIQMTNHYDGHYLKYISKTNSIINKNSNLKKLFETIKNEIKFNNERKLFFICAIKYNQQLNINKNDLNMISQAYFHEIFFNGLCSVELSNQTLMANKLKLFESESEFEKFYDKYLELSSKHFASGWLWFIRNSDNKIIIMDTQDANHPDCDLNDIIMCIDLWEHAYYTKYGYKRDEYIKNVFTLINWNYFV